MYQPSYTPAEVMNMSNEELARVVERERQRQAQYERGSQAAKMIEDGVNSLGGDNLFEKGFIEYMTQRAHRTLQQGSAYMLVNLFREWARFYDNGRYDPRNEAALELAKEIIKVITEKGITLGYVVHV